MAQKTNDPITFAVIKNALDTIVDDMAFAVMRTARSPIVRDVLDYSVTLCDKHGRILSQAKTVALHLGAVPDAMAVVMEKFAGKLSPGDVIAFNDPYEGGMHLPDIFMIRPIFHESNLRGFSVVIAHHCDVGGRVPGSNAADSTEIFQEGLRIPPMKIYSKGVLNETLMSIIGKNVRLPELVFGDLESQFATCNLGERELLRLIERYGADELDSYFDDLIDYGEQLTRAAIRSWPDGEYRFEDFIDGDGFSADAIPIRVKLTVRGDHLDVDFTGSSPQVKGAINSTLSFVKSATYLSVRCALDAEVPNNAGVYRCITVTAPEGSILNPQMPAAVAARALTGYRVVDTVLAFGGWDKETREPFVLVDMINGAWGGRFNKDGVEGVTNPSQNMSNLPVETLEVRYPMMMDEYSLRPDSCGAGEFRGGLGLIRQYRLLAKEAVLQIRADRHDHPPYGLFGGKPAAPCVNILDPDGENIVLPAKITRTIGENVVVRHEQAGGGGYGDPLKRSLELIADDLSNGKISAAYACEFHGVVFGADGQSIDPARTAERRKELA